jgi:hypothetical protein
MTPPAPRTSAEALGIMMLQVITTVLEDRLPLRLSVTDAAGQAVHVTISLPATGEAH